MDYNKKAGTNHLKRIASILLCVSLLSGAVGCTNTDSASSNDTAAVSQSGSTKETASYDTSAQYEATVLKDGDSITGGTYSATGNDESALEASGSVNATVTGAVIQKTAGNASSAGAASFRGVNSGVRVYGNADVTLTDCNIEASAKNATGVFAYENGVIHISNCTVNVTGGGAGGVQVAGGGTLIGSNLTVTSASKAAIRSDRGGGTLTLDGGTYTSTGSDGCPAIYSTADITVKNAVCTSTNSRAVIIEGKNSVTLENCTVTGNGYLTKNSKAGSVAGNVMLYQSASGDAAKGTSVFTMTGGTLTAQAGTMFYCTNISSVVNLNDVKLVYSEEGTLLIAAAGRWGKEGRNGGKCVFNATNQTLKGNIIVDSISSLTLNLTDSSFTGAIQNDGTADVVMDAGSTWKLTGDSSVSSLSGDTSGIDLNGFTLLVGGKAFSR